MNLKCLLDRWQKVGPEPRVNKGFRIDIEPSVRFSASYSAKQLSSMKSGIDSGKIDPSKPHTANVKRKPVMLNRLRKPSLHQ